MVYWDALPIRECVTKAVLRSRIVLSSSPAVVSTAALKLSAARYARPSWKRNCGLFENSCTAAAHAGTASADCHFFKRNAGCFCAGVGVRRGVLVAIGDNVLKKWIGAQSEVQDAKKREPTWHQHFLQHLLYASLFWDAGQWRLTHDTMIGGTLGLREPSANSQKCFRRGGHRVARSTDRFPFDGESSAAPAPSLKATASLVDRYNNFIMTQAGLVARL